MKVIERRSQFNIDWSLNITSLIAVAALIITLIKYGNEAMGYLKTIDAKTNIMWVHFDKTQMTNEELIRLGIK